MSAVRLDDVHHALEAGLKILNHKALGIKLCHARDVVARARYGVDHARACARARAGQLAFAPTADVRALAEQYRVPLEVVEAIIALPVIAHAASEPVGTWPIRSSDEFGTSKGSLRLAPIVAEQIAEAALGSQQEGLAVVRVAVKRGVEEGRMLLAKHLKYREQELRQRAAEESDRLFLVVAETFGFDAFKLEEDSESEFRVSEDDVITVAQQCSKNCLDQSQLLVRCACAGADLIVRRYSAHRTAIATRMRDRAQVSPHWERQSTFILGEMAAIVDA